MVSNQENIEPYKDKSFRELLLELRAIGLKARDLIDAAIRQGQREGIANDEIRRQILEIGIPYRTMLEYIPEDMKQKQSHAKSRSVTNRMKAADLQPFNARLVVEEVPKIPAPEQPIIEPEAEFNQQVREQAIQTQPRKHEKAFLPLPLADQLNKFLLARLIGMARSNGDNGIEFKINNEGELYVP